MIKLFQQSVALSACSDNTNIQRWMCASEPGQLPSSESYLLQTEQHATDRGSERHTHARRRGCRQYLKQNTHSNKTILSV